MVRLTPTITPAPAPSTPEARAEEFVELALGPEALFDIIVPRTNVAAKMRLPRRAERFAANADARSYLKESGFPVDATGLSALGTHEQWHYELGVRLLAVAVRDPIDPSRQLAPVEQWREECDDDQLDALWERYEDIRALVDPMDAGVLSESDAIAIIAASKKKDVDVLMSFGSRKLALFAITSASPPASSTTSES